MKVVSHKYKEYEDMYYYYTTIIRDKGNLHPVEALGGLATGGEGAPSRDDGIAGHVNDLVLGGHLHGTNKPKKNNPVEQPYDPSYRDVITYQFDPMTIMPRPVSA